jgi:hypothetical protein
VYVVPVVVVPNGNEPNAYTAAAKLQLDPCATPPYHVVKLYDGPLYANDNQRQYRNTLREIELDYRGNVFVTNANIMNKSDILWKFEPNGFTRRVNLGDSNGACHISAPIGLCVSNITNILYLASSLRHETDPNLTVIHGLSTATMTPVRTITIHGMQHITGITEDPVTKSLWATGFNLNSNPSPMPFYDPYIAKVPQGANDVCAVSIFNADDLSMPLSICWTGASIFGGADLDGNGTVNIFDFAIMARHWMNMGCSAPENPCEGADIEPQAIPDGDVDILDLDILANYWLNSYQ